MFSVEQNKTHQESAINVNIYIPMTEHPHGHPVIFVLLVMLPLGIDLLVSSYIYVTLTIKQCQLKAYVETNGNV